MTLHHLHYRIYIPTYLLVVLATGRTERVMMKDGAVKLKRHPDIKVAYVTMVNTSILSYLAFQLQCTMWHILNLTNLLISLRLTQSLSFLNCLSKQTRSHL